MGEPSKLSAYSLTILRSSDRCCGTLSLMKSRFGVPPSGGRLLQEQRRLKAELQTRSLWPAWSELLNTEFFHDHSLDLIDKFLQVLLAGNPGSFNRREHDHFDCSRPGFARPFTHQLVTVLESNRNDWDADLDCHVK